MEIIHSFKFYLKYKLTDERDDGRESEVLSHVVSSHAASAQIRLQSSRAYRLLEMFFKVHRVVDRGAKVCAGWLWTERQKESDRETPNR